MAKLKKYSDLDFNFTLHPLSSDVSRKRDTSAVINACKSLILTKFYERPFHPEIGSTVNALLFENDTLMTQNLLKKEIKKVILAFEPRVNNVESVVTVSRSGLQYDIEIFLQIFNLIEVVSFTATLDRIR